MFNIWQLFLSAIVQVFYLSSIMFDLSLICRYACDPLEIVVALLIVIRLRKCKICSLLAGFAVIKEF